MEKVAADEENPHRVVAQMFRLYDLIHLGRVDEAIRVGEGELARASASDADKAQIARPLFDAYTHERSDAANAGRMKALIEQTSTDDAPLQLLDAEMLAEVPRVEQGIESAAIQLADEPLVEVYPNPFNPAVTIAYRLTEESVVRLDVYDVLGRRVERLVDATQPAGRYEVVFSRSHLPTGVYLYHLEVGGQVRSGSVILVK
jgi:hypothetical protein